MKNSKERFPVPAQRTRGYGETTIGRPAGLADCFFIALQHITVCIMKIVLIGGDCLMEKLYGEESISVRRMLDRPEDYALVAFQPDGMRIL